MNNRELAKAIIMSRSGVAKSADFVAAGIRAVDVVNMCIAGYLERVRHGYYSLAGEDIVSEEQLLATLVPQGIVCVESALFYYGYSNFAPRKWSIAVPRTISRAKLEVDALVLRPYYVQDNLYELGKTTGSFQGVDLPVYDRERTICDCFKYRSRLDNELFSKALNAYANDTNVYCGHCGGRLTLTTSGRKRVRKDGTVIRETRARYQCHYNIRHPGECDGQSGYGVEKLDKLVNQIIRIQLGRIRSASSQELIAKQQAKEVDLAKSKLNLLNERYRQKQREYQDLRAETIKVIQGTSRLNVDLLNSLVAETSEQIKQLSWQIQTATAELEETVQSASQVLREYDQLMGWAEMYDNCTFEAKKMIVVQFVKAVHVRRDYEIDIEFNVSFEEFQALYLEGSQIKQKGREQIRS